MVLIECGLKVAGSRPRPATTRSDDVWSWVAGAVTMAIAIAFTQWSGWNDSPILSFVPFGVAIGVLTSSPGVFAALRERGRSRENAQ